DAMRAIEAVLTAMIADIELVIEWLKLLFEWKDIWQTKEIIEQFLGQAFGVLQGEVATAEAEIQTLVSTLETSLTSYFNGLIATLQSPGFPSQSFSDRPSTSMGAAAAARSFSPRALGSLPSVAGTSLVHYGWFLAKVFEHLVPSLGLGSFGSLNLETIARPIHVHKLLHAGRPAMTGLPPH